MDTHTKNLGRDVVNVIEAPKDVKAKLKPKSQERSDNRSCYLCGEVGHIRVMCPQQRKKKNPRANFVFAINESTGIHESQWILDTESSRYLVNDLSMLTDSAPSQRECLTAASDGSVLRITHQGTVEIQVLALEVVNSVRLLDVRYAENLERNILSYGKLEAKGCVLEYRGGKRVLNAGIGGVPVMDVKRCNNVLVVAVQNHRKGTIDTSREGMMAVIESPENESDSDVQCGTLMHQHRRLGHPCFDTIIKMAKDPTSFT